MFKFKEVADCGQTDSFAHQDLPVRVLNYLPSLPVASEKIKGVGKTYIEYKPLADEAEYSVQMGNEQVEVINLKEKKGAYLVEFPVSGISDISFKGNEDDRMPAVLDFLMGATSGRGIVCGKLQGVITQYCPFIGGGGLYIEKNGRLSACLTSSQQQEEEENISPKREGNAIIVQLQGNMLLCAVEQLTKKLLEDPGNANDVKLLTCYGLSVCLQPDPIALLRLIVDFECGEMKYEELFFSSAGLCSFLHIDCAVEYMLTRICL